MLHRFYCGDAAEILRALPAESVDCVVTSPPYFLLRDYGIAGQIGLEETPEIYVAKLVDVFREVWKVLRKDGTCWVNLGDSYAVGKPRTGEALHNGGYCNSNIQSFNRSAGLKPKNMVGIPWRVAFALQADGWYLRSDIIWSKPNAMPESVTDRPTKAHEYIFLLTKSSRYYYDREAIKEPAKEWTGQAATFKREKGKATLLSIPGQSKTSHRADRKQDDVGKRQYTGFNDRYQEAENRNKRDVWVVNAEPFPGSHFATFPPKLIEPCVLAGCPPSGIVLDPFGGAGTTSLVAARHGRNSIYIDLNPEYREMAIKRLRGEVDQLSLFADHSIEKIG